jgi:hypothetical protein
MQQYYIYGEAKSCCKLDVSKDKKHGHKELNCEGRNCAKIFPVLCSFSQVIIKLLHQDIQLYGLSQYSHSRFSCI